MEFTYAAYEELLSVLEQENYVFTDYHHPNVAEKVCILRHDIDMSIERSLRFARAEASRANPVRSTYYVLLRTDFYNAASLSNTRSLREIAALGHNIGLHFDEKSLLESNSLDIIEAVQREARILSDMVGVPVRSVSMHRPSPSTIEADYQFEGLVNTYSSQFFKHTKYISDSRRNWREDPLRVIRQNAPSKLQIVTHPIWYEDEDGSARSSLFQFMQDASKDRYLTMQENIRNLDEFIRPEEVV